MNMDLAVTHQDARAPMMGVRVRVRVRVRVLVLVLVLLSVQSTEYRICIEPLWEPLSHCPLCQSFPSVPSPLRSDPIACDRRSQCGSAGALAGALTLAFVFVSALELHLLLNVLLIVPCRYFSKLHLHPGALLGLPHRPRLAAVPVYSPLHRWRHLRLWGSSNTNVEEIRPASVADGCFLLSA